MCSGTRVSQGLKGLGLFHRGELYAVPCFPTPIALPLTTTATKTSNTLTSSWTLFGVLRRVVSESLKGSCLYINIAVNETLQF